MAEQALLKAVSSARYTQVKLLLQMGADVNCQDGAGQTPLIRALFLEDPKTRGNILRLLLRSGALVSTEDARERNALMWACTVSPYEDFLLLLRHADVYLNINNKNTTGQTALWTAVDLGRLEIVQELLKEMTRQEMKVEVPDHEGITPAMRAAMLGNYHCLRVMVSHLKDAGRSQNNVIDVTKIQKILSSGALMMQPQTAPESPRVFSRLKTAPVTPAIRVISSDGDHVLTHAGSEHCPGQMANGDLQLSPEPINHSAKLDQSSGKPGAQGANDGQSAGKTRRGSHNLAEQKSNELRRRSRGSLDKRSSPLLTKRSKESLNNLIQEKGVHSAPTSPVINGAKEEDFNNDVTHQNQSQRTHASANAPNDTSPGEEGKLTKDANDAIHLKTDTIPGMSLTVGQSQQASCAEGSQEPSDDPQGQSLSPSTKSGAQRHRRNSQTAKKPAHRRASHSRESSPVLLKTEEGGFSTMRDRKVRPKVPPALVNSDKVASNKRTEKEDKTETEHEIENDPAKLSAETHKNDEEEAVDDKAVDENVQPPDNDDLDQPAAQESNQLSPAQMRTDKWASETALHFRSSHSVQVSFLPPTATAPHSVQISFLPATEKSPQSVHVSFSPTRDKSFHSARTPLSVPVARSSRSANLPSAKLSAKFPAAKQSNPTQASPMPQKSTPSSRSHKVSFSPQTAISDAVDGLLHNRLKHPTQAAAEPLRKNAQAENRLLHKARHGETEPIQDEKKPSHKQQQTRLCHSAKVPHVSRSTEEGDGNQLQVSEGRRSAPAFPVQNNSLQNRSANASSGPFQRGLNSLPQHSRHRSSTESPFRTFITDASGRTPSPHLASRERRSSPQSTHTRNDPNQTNPQALGERKASQQNAISRQSVPNLLIHRDVIRRNTIAQGGPYAPRESISKERGRVKTVIIRDKDLKDLLPEWRRWVSTPNISTPADEPGSMVYTPMKPLTRPTSVRDSLPGLLDLLAEYRTDSFRKTAVKPKPPTPPKPKLPLGGKKIALFGGKKWSKLRGIHMLTRGLSKAAVKPSPRSPRPRSPVSPNPASESKAGGVAASVLTGLLGNRTRKISQGSSTKE